MGNENQTITSFLVAVICFLTMVYITKRKIRFKKQITEKIYDPFSIPIVKGDKRKNDSEEDKFRQQNLGEYEKNKFIYSVFGLKREDFDTSDHMKIVLNYVKTGQTFLGPLVFFALVKPFFTFIPSIFISIILNYIFFGIPIWFMKKVYNDKISEINRQQYKNTKKK